MKCNVFLPSSALALLLFVSFSPWLFSQSSSLVGGRVVDNFNEGWAFAKDLKEGDYSSFSVSTARFDSVSLPHTARIEPLVVNDQWMGTCWYRKVFILPKKDAKAIHYLYFEGAMQNAEVFLNGKLITKHFGGYLPFVVPLTGNVRYGLPNILAVKLVNTDDTLVPPGKPLNTLDFNRYGGIYRNVKLVKVSPLHITEAISSLKPASGGVWIRYEYIDSTSCRMHVTTTVVNESHRSQTFSVRQLLWDADKKNSSSVSEVLTLLPQQTKEVAQSLEVKQAQWWSPDVPHLYTLETAIFQKESAVDMVKQNVGLKHLQLTQKGLFLNGKNIRLSGTNRHQEYPFVGYALSDEAQWRDAVKIKNAGFNFVRLSHYPHAEAFMDACDALGIVTMDCIPGWQFNGNATFQRRVIEDVRSLIKRDRNRASVFFWELSLNESSMTSEFMDRILAAKKEELPYGQGLTCAWIDYEGYDLFIPARQHATPPHYWNTYKEGKRPLFIAEYGDWEYYAQNAGFNQTAFSDLKTEERTSRQLRGQGEKRLLQQAFNFQEAANSNLKGASTIGHANWLMFDYNRGYADDLEASGISDIFRLPKFAYYFYKSQRSPKENVAFPAQGGAMVFIAHYVQSNSTKDVTIFSNCEEVELWHNGKSLGKKKPLRDEASDELPYPPFHFSVDESGGMLAAVGYIQGAPVASHRVLSPQKPEAISLEIDESGIAINRTQGDVVFAYAHIVDAQGTPSLVHGTPIAFEVSGDAQIIGNNPATTEAGVATILLKIGKRPTAIRLTAKGEGLRSASWILPAESQK